MDHTIASVNVHLDHVSLIHGLVLQNDGFSIDCRYIHCLRIQHCDVLSLHQVITCLLYTSDAADDDYTV